MFTCILKDTFCTEIHGDVYEYHEYQLVFSHSVLPHRPVKQFYVAEGSKRNQFRPIFHKQDQILAGKKKDISNCSEQERPPRRSPPRRRPPAKKPKQKKKRKHEGKKPVKPKKEGAKTRNLKDATKHDHQLRTNHPVHTLKVGSLKANMARTMADNTVRAVLTSEQIEAISARLRIACVLLQRLRRHAYWACAVEIDRILRRKGTPESRKADLDDILDGDSFAKTLATLLLSGKFGPQSAYARAVKSGEEVTKPHSLETFELFSAKSGLGAIKKMPLDLEDVPGADSKTFTLTRSSELAMVQVQTALRCHYRDAQVSRTPKERSHA